MNDIKSEHYQKYCLSIGIIRITVALKLMICIANHKIIRRGEGVIF